MESLRRGPEGVSVGDPGFIRFQNARYRYLNDGYYIPLEQFCKLGKTEIQSHPDIAKIYQQASGLTHFFMHYDNGRYRDAIVEQLSQIYNVNLTTIPRVQTLEELTGVSFKDLDRQYGEFVRALEKPEELSTTPDRK